MVGYQYSGFNKMIALTDELRELLALSSNAEYLNLQTMEIVEYNNICYRYSSTKLLAALATRPDLCNELDISIEVLQ